jgi:hypothetical protein
MRGNFNLHESMEERAPVQLGSERSLGIVFAIVFLIAGLWPLLYSDIPRIWALVLAAVFVLLAYLAPKALNPLNRLWFHVGMLLHRVMNPLVMGIIFFLTVVPTGLVMRLLGRDPLRLRFDSGASTYWIRRDPPGPARDSFRNQF